jgi:hypothetical protein
MFPAKALIALLALAITFGVVRMEHGRDPLTGDAWVKLSISDRTVQTARLMMAQAVEATRAVSDTAPADLPPAPPVHPAGR